MQTLLPGKYKPTYAHHFLKLLENKGILLRVYSQNIDGLDRLAGLSETVLVEAHGSFATASCVECGLDYPIQELRECIANGKFLPFCVMCQAAFLTVHAVPSLSPTSFFTEKASL